jgi:hypothetical protein
MSHFTREKNHEGVSYCVQTGGDVFLEGTEESDFLSQLIVIGLLDLKDLLKFIQFLEEMLDSGNNRERQISPPVAPF